MRWLLAALVLVSCGHSGAAGGRLPPQRPADFAFTYQWSGGMTGDGVQVTVAAQSTYDRYARGGAHTSGTFTMSAAELDALYEAVRKAGADQIHLDKRKERVYDARSSSFTLTAGGQTWSIGDDADHVIAPDDQSKFNAVVAAVESAIAGKIPPEAPPPPSPPPTR
jgi:hypothetical protein